MSAQNYSDSILDTPRGVGLGLRRDLAQDLIENDRRLPAFVEFAPENWMGLGGHWKKVLKAVSERYPMLCHGLSLSLGSAEPLNWDFLKQVKNFFSEFPIKLYTEHLSYCKCDNAHLYDLLPMPFREDAIKHISSRIRDVQDFLERPIAIENVSYYTSVAAEMTEAQFIKAILEESGCRMLLDVNNIYVNSFNHGYDAHDFIDSLPLDRVAQIHMAGHEQRTPNLIIDTHGQAIIDPVFDLFEWTISKVRPVPVLLERDYNFEDIDAIFGELERLDAISARSWRINHAA